MYSAWGTSKIRGSRRLIEAAAAKGGDATWGVPLPPEQVERRRRNAKKLNLRRFLRENHFVRGRAWTGKQLALLRSDHDERIARQIGRTPMAVRFKRIKVGILVLRDWRLR